MNLQEMKSLLPLVLNDLGLESVLISDNIASFILGTRHKKIYCASVKKGKVISFRRSSSVNIVTLTASNKFLKDNLVELMTLYKEIETKPFSNSHNCDHEYFEDQYQINLGPVCKYTSGSVITKGYQINEMVKVLYDRRYFNKVRWKETDMLFSLIRRMVDHPYHKKFYKS